MSSLEMINALTNFQCTLYGVCDPKRTIIDDTIITTLHEHIKANDLRTLKPGNQINDVVVSHIGSHCFL